jgi:sarcosine oxidase subunit beta
MAYQLLKYALGGEYKEPRFFRDCQTPKKSYDAVIIGGGGHGLAGLTIWQKIMELPTWRY